MFLFKTIFIWQAYKALSIITQYVESFHFVLLNFLYLIFQSNSSEKIHNRKNEKTNEKTFTRDVIFKRALEVCLLAVRSSSICKTLELKNAKVNGRGKTTTRSELNIFDGKGEALNVQDEYPMAIC